MAFRYSKVNNPFISNPQFLFSEASNLGGEEVANLGGLEIISLGAGCVGRLLIQARQLLFC